MVGLGGLEPPTSPLSGARSNHLSYRPGQLLLKSPHMDVRFFFKLRGGNRVYKLVVELIGIEPTTPCLQSRCSPS
jgi:hypothetical protein